MRTTGEKIGPGPATLNIRGNIAVPKKSNALPKSRRHIGEPNPSVKYDSAPGQYERQDHKNGNKIKNSSVKFGKGERSIDFIR